MEISIIIPIYNSAKWLERCAKSILESIKAADVKAEIILVDNNSTDESPQIIQALQKQKSKIIKTAICKTQGAAATRNYGVGIAQGKYIWFVDADDTIRTDAVTKLLTTAKQYDADIVMLGMQRVYPDGHTDYLSAVCPKEKDYKSRFVRYGLGPVQLLIRKDWWTGNDLCFREGIIHEDMELMSSLILYTDKFACVNEPLYHYYQNTDSVLHKTQWNSHCYDIFPALEGLYKRFQQKNATSLYHDELEWFFIWNLLIDSAKDFGKFREGREGFRRSREMLKKYYPKWRKNRFLKQKPLKLQILVRLNYYGCGFGK